MELELTRFVDALRMDAVSVWKGVTMAKGKPFAPEFQQEAVRLYRVSGKPFRAVAEDLAAAPESLRRGLLQAPPGGQPRNPGEHSR